MVFIRIAALMPDYVNVTSTFARYLGSWQHRPSHILICRSFIMGAGASSSSPVNLVLSIMEALATLQPMS